MSGGLKWRSPLAFLFGEKTQWGECENAAIAEFVPGETEAAAQCAGVCDLSPLPRTGAIGECPKTPPINAVELAKDGALVCRLGGDEILILPAPDGTAASKILPAPRLIIPRRDSHCQIGVCGARAAEVLARLCAVLPPQFPALLQTRVADISAIIVPEPRIAAGSFYLLARQRLRRTLVGRRLSNRRKIRRRNPRAQTMAFPNEPAQKTAAQKKPPPPKPEPKNETVREKICKIFPVCGRFWNYNLI